ncbi:MAG: DUF72 domain-containing protein [Chloroflexi bacterium]|nr:DUF72 domain-containing protein [Chloroflexota bacterium]
MAARLYIGASSWADKSLVASGRFYPPELNDTPSRLAFYAERFNLAEVDSTYYALPSHRNIERWAGAVADGFRFNVKAFALFTQHPTRLSSIPKSFHEALPAQVRKKARVYYKDIPSEVRDELWQIFRRALQPMREGDKLGAILIDFPPWFVPSKENHQFIAHARERLPDDNVIVEFRNQLWVADDDTATATFDLLRELHCGFVCVDEPQGLKTSFPPTIAVTAPVAAVRLRGRNADRWEDKSASTEERLHWWYTDEELAEWLPRIEQLAGQAEELYLTFNTKAEDQSVVNAARLQRLLRLG